MSIAAEPTCPDCEGEVTFDLTCHTWPRTTPDGGQRWMSCLPCDSAVKYFCENCDWHYVHGLNPGNPRAAESESRRPSWLPASSDERAPGVRAVWDAS